MGKEKGFPKTLYVRREEADSEEEWLHAEAEAKTLAQVGRVAVAVYELKSVRVLATVPTLISE